MTEDNKKPEKIEDKLLDHNYDGIEEYDNDLPKWWLSIFYISIVFAIFYIGLYHIGPWRFASQRLGDEMAAINQKKQDNIKKVESEINEETLLVFAKNENNLQNGKKIFDEKCAVCHLQDGGGLIGPNLTDNNWIHGGTLMDIRNVVLKGVPAKGMVPWEGVLSSQEVKEVVSYVHSLRGTTPATPKQAEGEEFIYQ